MRLRLRKYLFCLLWSGFAGGLDLAPGIAQAADDMPPLGIGTRIEMFVDGRLIDPSLKKGVSLELQTPIKREVVLTADKPWEGIASAYFTVLQDGPRFRMYYRG